MNVCDISLLSNENLQAEAYRFYRKNCRKGRFSDIEFNVVLNILDNTLSLKKTLINDKSQCKVYQLKAFNHVFDINETLVLYRDDLDRVCFKRLSQFDGVII